MRRRRRRSHRWRRSIPLAAALILAAAAGGFFSFLYWPEHYIIEILIPITLVALLAMLRVA
jgi:uncharacterized membrane protein YfcA